MKKIILILFMFIFSCFAIFASETKMQTNDSSSVALKKAGIVQSVEYIDINENDYVQVKQSVVVKLLNSNKEENNIVVAENMLTGNPFYDIKLKKGMKVYVNVEDSENGVVFSVEDVQRSHALVYLSLLFCGLLIFVGRKKGLCSLISIILTCLLIFYLHIPLMLHGVNAILGTMIICILSTIITMYLVGGFNKKSSSATLGCILSILFAYILAFITVKVAYLTGFSGESTMFLYSAHPELNFIDLVISAVLLATLGAVMDVAMSIASTINEVYEVDNTKSVKELFKSGMNVGKDIIGTMANTLILVYLGGSLPLLLLASDIDWCKFINLNQVVTEISSALIGSCAIVICVPLTAFVTANLIKATSKN